MEKKQNKLDTIVEEEEEETRTFQKETIPAADISERNPKDKIDKSDLSDVPDDEDNAVVIVDLVDIVRKKETGCADKSDKKEGSCDSRLAGESSRHKLERRQFRDKEDCPHGMSEEELKTPEKNRIDKDKKETPFSTNKGNVSGCSSGDESQPETFRPISETRFEHPTGSVVADIEDVVENLAPNQSWASLFNWGDFGYSLILGFAPTAWDVYSDLTIADELAQKERDTISAGLSYLFICFPGLYMFNEALTEKLSSYSSVIAVVVNFCWTIALSSAMFYASWKNHLLFRYPAILIGILVVITKGLAIFVHTPEMKKIAERMTMGEFKTEAPLQLLLLLHLWVSGRPLSTYLPPILSSLLIIGKVNAEMYLSDAPEDLMKGKSFLQKLWLTLKYVPLFSSTAFFRVGCGILKHSGPYANVSGSNHVFVFFVSVWAGSVFFTFLYLLTFAGVKLAFPASLADITILELGRGVVAEFTTVSNWGCLGRDRSK